MIKEAILKVYKNEDLTYDEAYQTMDEIMSGEASEVQMSAYLTAMSMKGETIDEITASAEAMRAHCVRLLNDEDVLEIVGTGGDGSNTFNISTTSSIIISAAGVPVAKHGNRSASSKCGAADVLEELGVNINIEPEKSLKCLKEINLCFLFAQNYLPTAMRNFICAVLTIVLILVLETAIYAFALQAIFENTVKQTLKNGFLLAVQHPLSPA